MPSEAQLRRSLLLSVINTYIRRLQAAVNMTEERWRMEAKSCQALLRCNNIIDSSTLLNFAMSGHMLTDRFANSLICADPQVRNQYYEAIVDFACAKLGDSWPFDTDWEGKEITGKTSGSTDEDSQKYPKPGRWRDVFSKLIDIPGQDFVNELALNPNNDANGAYTEGDQPKERIEMVREIDQGLLRELLQLHLAKIEDAEEHNDSSTRNAECGGENEERDDSDVHRTEIKGMEEQQEGKEEDDGSLGN